MRFSFYRNIITNSSYLVLSMLASVQNSFVGRFFPEIYNLSGQPENVKKYGPWFDYHQNPRAQIFKRGQGKVIDLNSLIKLMR